MGACALYIHIVWKGGREYVLNSDLDENNNITENLDI